MPNPLRSKAMSQLMAYGTGIAAGFIAWGLVAEQHFWPALRHCSRADAMRPLLLVEVVQLRRARS